MLPVASDMSSQNVMGIMMLLPGGFHDQFHVVTKLTK